MVNGWLSTKSAVRNIKVVRNRSLANSGCKTSIRITSKYPFIIFLRDRTTADASTPFLFAMRTVYLQVVFVSRTKSQVYSYFIIIFICILTIYYDHLKITVLLECVKDGILHFNT